MRKWIVLLLLIAAAGTAAVAYRRRATVGRWLMPLWVRTVSDVAYGPASENRLDILSQRWGGGDSPGVLVFHGGGWIEGSREDMVYHTCRRYLERGFVVANVEYRKGAIAPAVEDASRALDWFWRNAAANRVDRKRIVLTGDSAGAHLALMAAFRSDVPVRAVVDFYGPTDLAANLSSTRALLPSGGIDAARALSPITYVRRGLPPVELIHGTADDLVPIDQTDRLARALKSAGSEASVYSVEGGRHGFTAPQLDEAYRAVFEFLKQHGIL